MDKLQIRGGRRLAGELHTGLRQVVPEPVVACLGLAEPGVSLGEGRVDVGDGKDVPADAPTITIDASGSMGEIRIEN